MSPLRIGLTGGISSGKSLVSSLFADRAIPIIDADKIARDLFRPGSHLLNNLREKFGDSIFYDNHELNRKALGNIVFNSKTALKWLNQLTHPEVSKQIQRELDSLHSPYVILDIPLLIDVTGKIPIHLKEFIDRVLVINVNLETQLKRLCHRDQISLTDAQAIIKNQSTLEQKLALADDIIDNNGSVEQLEHQIKQLHQYYLSLTHISK